MTGDRLTAPGLLAHVFLALDGEKAAAGWDSLRALWDEVTSGFGLDRPIASLDVPARLPSLDVLPEDGAGLLAMAESDAEAIWQAMAWAEGGLAGVTVMMSPPRDDDCAEAWATLAHRWGVAAAEISPATMIGEVRILLALVENRPAGDDSASPADPAGDDSTIHRALDLVRTALTAARQPAAQGWWRHWDTVILGPPGDQAPAWVWETGPEVTDGRSARRLAVVAPERLERQVDHFLWTLGDGSPTPLTRHLMYAARLRHQIRVFDDGRMSRRVRDELGGLVDEVSGDVAAWYDPAGQPEQRDRLSARLVHAQAEALGLRARLDKMRIAVGGIGQDMARAVSLIAADVAVGPLSEDQHLATWLCKRLDDEIAMLDSVVLNARSAAGLLGANALPIGRAPGSPAPGSKNGLAAVGLHGGRARQLAGPPAPRVVILTALPVEYDAIRSHLAGRILSRAESGTLYEIGDLPGTARFWRVAIAQTGPGNAMAAVQLERAVRVFQPEIALFVGVAGGRKDVLHGDVVAADKIYDYESGKSAVEGYQPRMSSYRPAYRLVQRAQLVARQGRWHRRIRPACPHPAPRAFVKPIATGAKVVAHDRSAIARLLDKYASDALAIETEGYGFLEGAYANPGVDALVIRGISDLLAGKDSAGDEQWQPIASAHAAAFAVELLDGLTVRLG